MFYQLALQGFTYSGDTNFPGPNTTYTPLEPFSTVGGALLAVEAPIAASNGTTGANSLDVGLYVGQPLDLNVFAGELLWASNNAIHYFYNVITGASEAQLAAIDETFQAFDEATRTLSIDIDTNTALTTNIDNFIKTSGLLGAPAEIVDGGMTIRFSADAHDISGNATFIGNGFITPGASAWQAAFAGRLFDGLEYIASNVDLIQTLGADRELGVQHFLQQGWSEGRLSTFDGLQYIASHPDLILAFGGGRDLGTVHFIANGVFEGRNPDSFDAAQYLANYGDLQAAFGTDEGAATTHYILVGFSEGRTDDFVL